MDFYITKEEIVKSLSATLGVVEKRQTLPILSNVLISVDEASVKLKATDLESEIETLSTITNFKSGGQTTAPAKKLSELCRLLPDLSEIHVFLDGENLKIETSSGKYSLATLPSADFPIFDIEEDKNKTSIQAPSLKELINKTSFAMGNQDWRHYLNGCYMEKSLNTLSITATDSQKIAQYKCEFSGETDFAGIIPRKSAVELMKILPNEDIEVQFYINDNNIAFMSKNFTFKSKLIDGNYPDLTPHLSGESGPSIKTDRKNLIDTLTRTSVFANTQFNAVKLTTLDGKLEVSAYNPGQESAEEKLDFEGNLTAPFDLAFNANLLKELLLTTDDENVTISKCGQGVMLLTSDPNQTTFLLPLLIS